MSLYNLLTFGDNPRWLSQNKPIQSERVLVGFPLFTAPISSISSMEVNVDLLDQMEVIEISDQDNLDVFFSSVGDEGSLTSPLTGMMTKIRTTRMSSTSSDSSSDSQNINGAETPLVGSDEEETQGSRAERRGASPGREERTNPNLHPSLQEANSAE
uniref:Uncharacterized protein n=1 Tax=Kryptolebias marmoratus TaxID=37003 RepID=A0A3Q2ZVJ4_KRYMA